VSSRRLDSDDGRMHMLDWVSRCLAEVAFSVRAPIHPRSFAESVKALQRSVIIYAASVVSALHRQQSFPDRVEWLGTADAR
jgi:hypothetical protein